MKKSWLRTETALYIFAFILALLVRFARLGELPLSDQEALLALQSLQVAGGQELVIGPHPGYILLTGALFFLFGDSNVTARFLPAILGALLVFLPILFRRQLGRIPAVLLAFGLALDPGLVALSRQAASEIWAIAFGSFSFGFFQNKAYRLAGITFGLALLGGSTIVFGLVVFGIVWLISKAFSFEETSEYLQKKFPLQAFLIAGVTFLLAGSMFFLYPNGLSAAAASVPVFVTKWWSSGNLSAVQALLSLIVYNPLAFLFALIQTVLSFTGGNKLDRLFAMTWLTSLLLALILPGRQYGDLAWSLLPMWVLTVRLISSSIRLEAEDRIWVWGEALLFFLLMSYAWINLVGLLSSGAGNDAQVRWISTLGAGILLILSIILIAWGWNLRVAVQGALFGLAISLAIFTLSGMSRAAGFSTPPANQLWRSGPGIAQADLLTDTIGDLSEWKTGTRQGIDGLASVTNMPSLEWALREFPAVQFDSALYPESSPSIVVSTLEQNVSLAAEYRGQDFSWTITPAWDIMLPLDWLKWIAFRQVPQNQQQLILWARTDLFPGSTVTQNAVSQP